ncbi:MAG: WHG domain-containing protein [Candidatus Sabulitectum sp.]|nr:WHG domain-containing protein [Candidatus Sabulitectum sp.]
MRKSFERNTQPEKPENALAAILKNYIIFATGNPMLYELMFSRGIFSLLVPEELRKVASDACSGVTEILQRMKSENDSVMSINTVWAWFTGSPF